MKMPKNALKVSDEFTREGLRQHVMSHLDEESYSDESLYHVYEEFNYRLGLKVNDLAETMKGFEIEFFWAVNLGRVVYNPKDELDEYFFTDARGKEWNGLDAILAFLRDEVNVEAVESDYWSSRSPSKSWKEDFEKLSLAS